MEISNNNVIDPVFVDDEFPKCGIRFSYLIDEFVPSHDLEGLTTKEVCEFMIKPATIYHSSSYCHMLRSQNRHDAYSEEPTAFISHAHSYEFLDVISALRYHLRNELDTVIWFDLFSINQHITTDWSFEWLSTTFKSAVVVNLDGSS